MSILIKLTARLTHTTRYRPEFEWSKSWVYNLFRVSEWLFGRKYGIRREAVASISDKEVVYQFFTWEAVLCYLEGEVRSWFKLPKFERVEIWVPVLATVGQTNRLPVKIPYLFAIARDTSASANPGTVATGSTFKSFTVTGSNPFIFTIFHDNTDNTDAITSATYNAASMTQGQKTDLSAGSWAYMYYRLNPSTGTNSLVLNFSNSPRSYIGFVGSYSGVSGTGLDNTNFTTDANCSTATHSITPVATGCWAVVGEANVDANPAAGTGSNVFGTPAQQTGIFDSNGTITAGNAYSMTITVSGGSRNGMFSQFTIKPPATTNGNFLIFM